MTDYPMHRSPRCGAKTRGARGGRPCRAPAMANGSGKCRLHGGHSPGAAAGPLNPMFKHGRYSREAKEVSQFFRQMARDGETMVARVMNQHGLKPPRAIRRRRHVKQAIEAAAKAKEQPK
jgi:hypothetical protein